MQRSVQMVAPNESQLWFRLKVGNIVSTMSGVFIWFGIPKFRIQTLVYFFNHIKLHSTIEDSDGSNCRWFRLQMVSSELATDATPSLHPGFTRPLNCGASALKDSWKFSKDYLNLRFLNSPNSKKSLFLSGETTPKRG